MGAPPHALAPWISAGVCSGHLGATSLEVATYRRARVPTDRTALPA